jgi:hypothetical protein
MKKPHIKTKSKMLIAWVDKNNKIQYMSNMTNQQKSCIAKSLSETTKTSIGDNPDEKIQSNI